VCAMTETGYKVTHLNLCYACNNPKVVSYELGRCSTTTGVQPQAFPPKKLNARLNRKTQNTNKKSFSSIYVSSVNLQSTAQNRVPNPNNFYHYRS
jgi:hypothetical protein